MSIKLLRTLVAVAEHRSFSEAARAVHVTHAAVSQRMRALEADLGVALFDRGTRTPELTAAGRAVVERARTLIRDYDDLVPSALGRDGLAGEVVLGAVPTTLTGLAPGAMAVLKVECPDLHVRIRPGLSAALLADVERGGTDAALVTRPATLARRLAFRPVADEPLQLIASREVRGDDPLELLERHPFIRFNRDAVVGAMIEAWIQDRGLRVREAMELDSLEAISSMVFADLGVSIVPDRCVAPRNRLPLRRLPLGEGAPSRTLGLAYETGTPKLRVVEAIHAALVQTAGARSPAPAPA